MAIRVKFKVSIIVVLTMMIMMVGLSISGLFWVVSSDIAEDMAEDLFSTQTHNAESSFSSLMEQALVSAAVGARQPDTDSIADEFIESPYVPVAIETLRQFPAFYSLYYGFDDSRFFQLIATRGLESVMTRHKAPKNTAWIVRSIKFNEDGRRMQYWAFMAEDGKFLGQFDEPAPAYNPTKRPWYQSAKDDGGVVLSEPYLFNSLQKPGLTASRVIDSGKGVFGVDLTLDGVTREISALTFSPNGGLILHDQNNKLIAMSDKLGTAKLMSSLDDVKVQAVDVLGLVGDNFTSGELKNIKLEKIKYYVRKDILEFAGMKFYLGAVAPVSDFNGAFTNLQKQIIYVSAAGLVIFIPLAYFFAAGLAKSVTELTRAARKVRNMDFDVEGLESSAIEEFDNLVFSFSDMSVNLKDRTEALKIAQAKLARLVELGISMSAEKDGDKLMEMVLVGAKELTNADGCSLYTINDDNQIEFKIFRNDSLGIAFGGTTGKDSEFPPIPLYNEDGSLNDTNVVSYAIHNEATINVADAYTSEQFEFAGPKSFDAETGYQSKSILTVPLKPQGGAVIGALQIVNAQDKDTGEIIPFSEEIRPFVEALSAQAATSLFNRQLVDAQERLMDALIQLIAGAIDAKSPYTGGHCERVPILARRLAEEASVSNEGSFADFRFESKDEWREFEIGAWLHDCGKVVTPEYVVDKASKLETIYNRIHEVRTRFEVLLRDAKIESLEAVMSGTDAAEANSAYETRKAQLIDDFAFIAECNIGGEFMSDEYIERLKKIADTPWQRNFNIHLGLAHEEALRYVGEPEGPCEEKLLDDKVFHVIPRIREVKEVFDEFGFKLEVPDNLYNQGEVYNLSVRRGTLTDEERFKINEHIMQSIVMLEQLPLPDHLKRVPEYAGTHHETMIGSGYPRKLAAEELSVPARIMAIADIFEALTASDRPYKKAKTLSEAVKILSFFKKDQHIDGELFDLFLTSGVYREYAEKFLLPDQIDEVDIAQFVG